LEQAEPVVRPHTSVNSNASVGLTPHLCLWG